MKKDVYIQYLRALAIIMVVIIHILPHTGYTVLVRQFINFAVGLFFFLSGYLTNKNIGNVSDFYKKRIIKVIIPYIIWSLIFILKNGNFNIKSIIIILITGQACAAYYYIIVYIQFVLITPLLVKILDMKLNKYIWLLTPMTLIINYMFIYINKPIPFPYNVLSFSVWFIFYYFGLQVRNLKLEKDLNDNLNKNVIMYILFLLLSMAEGYLWWNKYDNYSIAISQIKITSTIASILFCKICIGIKDKVIFKSKILKVIGDYSFGIYLTHILFIHLLKNYISYTILLIIMVLVVDLIFIHICRKFLGRFNKYLGFV